MRVRSIQEIREINKDLLGDERVKRMCEWYRTGPSPLVETEPLFDSAKYLERCSKNASYINRKPQNP